MSELLYIDTNVWLDYFFNRTQGWLSPADISLNILQRTVSCEFTILLSQTILFELEKHIPQEKLSETLKWLKPKIVLLKETMCDKAEAKNIPIHRPDNLHWYLSLKYKAIMISNDKELIQLGAIPSHIL